MTYHHSMTTSDGDELCRAVLEVVQRIAAEHRPKPIVQPSWPAPSIFDRGGPMWTPEREDMFRAGLALRRREVA